MNTLERGDTEQYVITQLLGELAQNIAGFMAIQMHQDGGDDLRMLALDQLRDRLRIDPFEPFYTAGVVAFQNTADNVRRLVLAQRPFKYRSGIAFGVEIHKKVFSVGAVAKIAEHGIDLLLAQVLDFCHCDAQLLHLERVQMLEYLHCLIFAQR